MCFSVRELAAGIRDKNDNPFTLIVKNYKQDKVDKTSITFAAKGVPIEELYSTVELVNQATIIATDEFLPEFNRLVDEQKLYKPKFDRGPYKPVPNLEFSIFSKEPESEDYDISYLTDLGLVCKKLHETYETYYNARFDKGAKYLAHLLNCPDGTTADEALAQSPINPAKEKCYLTADQTTSIRKKYPKLTNILLKNCETPKALVPFVKAYFGPKSEKAGDFNPRQNIRFKVNLPDKTSKAYKYRTIICDRDRPNIVAPDSKVKAIKVNLDGNPTMLNAELPFHIMQIDEEMNISPPDVDINTLPATKLGYGTVIHNLSFQPRIDENPPGFMLMLPILKMNFSQKRKGKKLNDFSYMSSEEPLETAGPVGEPAVKPAEEEESDIIEVAAAGP